MYIRTFATSVFALALPALVNGETWTSPDGFLSVTPPDANTFQAMPTPPSPFLKLWVSSDGSMKFAFGVIKAQFPSQTAPELNQSFAEHALAEEIGGKVSRLPTREVSGHEVWTMRANGPSVDLTQAIVRHNADLYKVMATTFESKHSTRPHLIRRALGGRVWQGWIDAQETSEGKGASRGVAAT